MAVPARLRNSLALIALLTGCGGGPQAPDWQSNAAQALAGFQRLYLGGNTAAAENEFQRARSELASTGRPDLVARAELVRCAVRTSSLEFDDCPGFQALRDGASAEELAYAAYLQGKGKGRPTDDPLSRLVAHGVTLRAGSVTPAGIASAVDIASEQGWRRPLLAWLGVQLTRAEQAGDSETAAGVRRRMALISS
ncbi:MAG TPA: hypothetical protein VIQ55_08230 [Burkholderiales bacterium]|jgi:hypothetical protein